MLYVPTLRRHYIVCLFFWSGQKNLKHKYYPTFIREKTEATEKVSDLPEVRKSVAEPSSNTRSGTPPHSTTQLTSRKCQSPWQPSGSQTLHFLCLIFMVLPVQSNSVPSSNTKLHPLRADASDSVMGPYARPQYSQLQNGANQSSTKRQEGIKGKGRSPGIRKN